MKKTYMCIDLKSFYASVECIFRGLDPLCTNLVVADISRTEKTICLAVTPSLKEYGIPGRARLFEVVEAVKKINEKRLKDNNYKPFTGKSFDKYELKIHKDLALDYIIATPQMAKYIDVSKDVYKIFLKYFAAEDIHVYSIDESFIDITGYLGMYKKTPEDLARDIVKQTLESTGVTATCGIGDNMYLAKIAMDIVAKHEAPDKYGCRIAYLSEELYKKTLWGHKPLTDFWRIGAGISRRLESLGVTTMGELARLSIKDEGILYKEFGINAEIIIDHAWGIEPVTIKDVKTYKPASTSTTVGQVLHEPYDYKRGRVVIKEMAEELASKMFAKNIYTKNFSIAIGYDISSTLRYDGDIDYDYLGRAVPKGVHMGIKFDDYTNSSILFVHAAELLFDYIMDRSIKLRRLNVFASDTITKEKLMKKNNVTQLNIFENIEEVDKQKKLTNDFFEKEDKVRRSILDIKNKYGKNAVVKASNLEDGATQIERNEQIGGHKA